MGIPRLFHVGGLVLAVVLVAACAKTEPAPEPVRAVKLMTVGPQPMVFEHEYAGDVRARSEARLGFRVAGKLLARSVEVGQRVQAGQVLAQLDASDYLLAANAAQAQVQAARTQRDLAAADLKRYAELKAQNFISGAELERREAALKSAQASLDQAMAQNQGQVNQKDHATLKADKSGVVVAVEAEPGQVLAAGTPVVRVAYDGPRDVVVALPEHQLAGVQVGTRAVVRLWAADQERQGTVREVAAAADPATRTFAVKLALDGGAAEAPLGATAYVRWARPAGAVAVASVPLKLPTSALWAQGQGSAVWLFDAASSTVKAQPVVVATADGNQAVIASGLKGGEQVVVAGVHVLAEGQKVVVYREKQASKQGIALSNEGVSAIKSGNSEVAASAQKGQP